MHYKGKGDVVFVENTASYTSFNLEANYGYFPLQINKVDVSISPKST